MICNDLRTEVLTMEMCAPAKKILPRPKVGDFCSVAMEQAFSDVCVSLCLGKEPKSKLSKTCRAAAMEMPRPTVRKWCEHGYTVAFQKSIIDLRTYFMSEASQGVTLDPIVEPINVEVYRELETVNLEDDLDEIVTPTTYVSKDEAVTTTPFIEVDKKEEEQLKNITPSTPLLLATFPVTLGDVTYNMEMFEKQSPEDAVVVFCRKNMVDDVSGCIRQVLPMVLEQIA